MKINKDVNKTKYPCNDLALIALLALYFPVEHIDRTNPHKSIFFFDDSQKLQDTINKFWNNTLTVEPKTYFQSIKLIKARIYEG